MLSRDSPKLKISIKLVQPIAQRAHFYRCSIVHWQTLLDKKVDDFKVNTDGTKSQPIESLTSSLKSQ